MANQVTHFEIMGTDAASLQDFYHNAFGWDLKAEPNMQGYAVVQNSNGTTGGVGGSPGDDYPGHLTFYVCVDDIAASLRKVEQLGGKVLRGPIDLPNDRGQFAHFEDPQGHMIGLVQPAQRG